MFSLPLLHDASAAYEGLSTLTRFSPRRATLPPARHTAPPLSAVVLTFNSAARLPEVLAALAWCDEVIVFDTGSTDATLSLASRFSNVSLHRLTGPFPGFGQLRRRAIALARHDWILSIDSDEIVSRELAAEIATLPLDPGTVYAMPFENYFNGRHITTCGWAPDRHERLFNRTVTNFCASAVHERVGTQHLAVRLLRQPVRHHSYESLDDFLRKQRAYARLFAEQHVGRKPSGPATAASRAAWAFFKSYLLQRGCLQGTDGLVISAYKAQTVFWKYLLLHEANRRLVA